MVGFTEEDEQIPYRTPATAPDPKDETDIDDEEFSTLTQVQEILDKAFKELQMDVTELDAENVQKLQAQILGKQEAHAILEPIKQAIDSAIDAVKAKRKGNK